MRAVVAHGFGGPEVLVVETVPDPGPGPSTAVVEVHAADVLTVETQIRRGLAEWFPVTFPWTPGLGASGVVRAVGDDVDRAWLGRRVAAVTERGGSCAELVAVDAGELLRVPDALEHDVAAVLLHDGRTALGLAAGTPVEPGDDVLVTAAAGGAALLLVGLARAAGGRVIATVRGAAKAALASDAGADAVVDHADPAWPDAVRAATGGRGPTVVYDGAGGAIGARALEITADGGRFSAHGAAAGGAAVGDPDDLGRRRITRRGVEQVQFSPPEARRVTSHALAEAAAGRLRPVIGARSGLAGTAEAHRAMEERTVAGRTIVTP